MSMSSIEWVNWEVQPHSQPLPTTGSGGRVWRSRHARHPRPNLDLSAPQLHNLQHHTMRMLQDAVVDDVVEDQPRLFAPGRARGHTRLPWQPADKAALRLWLPESRLPLPHHHYHHHHHHHNSALLDSSRL